MSMSADATCRGLRNARDGQYVLELTKGDCHLNYNCMYVRLVQSASLKRSTMVFDLQ